MIKILLLEKDMEYGYMLGKTISNLHSNFNVSVAPIEDYLERGKVGDSNKTKEYDLTLLGGYPSDWSDTPLIPFKNPIFLSEEPVVSLDDQLDIYYDQIIPILKVYKYSKVSLLVSDINYIYGRITGKQSLIKGIADTKIISFYSASQGVGTTSISLSVARELSRYRDKMVLYLSFEEIPSSPIYIEENTRDRYLSNFLYYLFEKKEENLSLDSFTFKNEDGVIMFSLGKGINEISNLSKEELAELFKILLSNKKFDYIILDLNSDLKEETFYVLNLSKAAIIIETSCVVSRYKNRIFFEYANLMKENGFLKQMTLIRNRVIPVACHQSEIQTSPSDPSEKQIDIRIEEDKGSFEMRDGGMRISINNVFGMGIKSLVDKILTY